MTRAKGIYIFGVSPFRQKAFADFGKELKNIVQLHWKGSILYGGAAIGACYLGIWSNKKYEESLRKNPADFKNEVVSG